MNKPDNILFTFPALPLSVCTQTGPLNLSIEKFIQAQIIVNDDGLINLIPWVEPSEIYLSQHNNSIGKIWYSHNIEFSKFISYFETKNIVEIGSGAGNLYKEYTKHHTDVNWKMIDLNPTINDERVEIVKGLYTPELISNGDVVVSSHFLEHQFNISEFLMNLRNRNPKLHLFSIPNFSEYAKSNYASTIMFEHPNYLSERYLEYILPITGWEIVEKQHYKKHSVFYATRPTHFKPYSPSHFDENNKNIDVNEILTFLKYMNDRAQFIKKMNDPFYVYGAHFTYYYLLNMGVSPDQIIAVVDGDPAKQGRRMYGTNHKIISPNELPDGANVFVEMGPYNSEIIQHSLHKNIKLV